MLLPIYAQPRKLRLQAAIVAIARAWQARGIGGRDVHGKRLPGLASMLLLAVAACTWKQWHSSCKLRARAGAAADATLASRRKEVRIYLKPSNR